MYEDKKLICKDCGAEFVFTAGEQEFFAEKGLLNEPKRCKNCLAARKNGGKTFYEGVCAKCGGVARVKFQPREDRPIYCSECFAAMNADK